MVKEIVKLLFPKTVFCLQAEVHREYARLGVRRRFKLMKLPSQPLQEGVVCGKDKLEIELYIER